MAIMNHQILMTLLSALKKPAPFVLSYGAGGGGFVLCWAPKHLHQKIKDQCASKLGLMLNLVLMEVVFIMSNYLRSYMSGSKLLGVQLISQVFQ